MHTTFWIDFGSLGSLRGGFPLANGCEIFGGSPRVVGVFLKERYICPATKPSSMIATPEYDLSVLWLGRRVGLRPRRLALPVSASRLN